MDSPVPIERIVIPIDFTDSSRAAFYAGLSMATKFDAETWVLHVSEPLKSFDFSKKRYVETNETIERVEQGVRRRVDELWQEGGLEAVDRRRVHIIVRGGKAAQEIVNTAKAKGASLVVIGAGGSGGHMGRTAERVVRSLPSSVLCVRHDENPDG